MIMRKPWVRRSELEDALREEFEEACALSRADHSSWPEGQDYAEGQLDMLVRLARDFGITLSEG